MTILEQILQLFLQIVLRFFAGLTGNSAFLDLI